MVFLIFFIFFMSALTVEAKERLNYLALGNSLAAGVQYDGSIGKGYPDYIAEKLRENKMLGSFEKRYAVPGYTTIDVLNDIKDDVKKEYNGKPDKKGIRKSIANADIITLDVGANDILPYIDMDSETGTIQIDFMKIYPVISEAKDNVEEIVREIRGINPSAQIYLMGYYNPFQNLPADSQLLVETALDFLNDQLETIAVDAEAAFVPTADAIAGNTELYLPNPLNIHPGEDGYRIIADQFWGIMESELFHKDYTAYSLATLISEPELFQNLLLEKSFDEIFVTNMDPQTMEEEGLISYSLAEILENSDLFIGLTTEYSSSEIYFLDMDPKNILEK